MWAEHSFILSQFTCSMDAQTDGGWMDGFTISETALHTMQRGKNGC